MPRNDSVLWKQDISFVRCAGMKFPFQENLNFTPKIWWLGIAGKAGLLGAHPSGRVVIGRIKGANDLWVVLNCSGGLRCPFHLNIETFLIIWGRYSLNKEKRFFLRCEFSKRRIKSRKGHSLAISTTNKRLLFWCIFNRLPSLLLLEIGIIYIVLTAWIFFSKQMLFKKKHLALLINTASLLVVVVCSQAHLKYTNTNSQESLTKGNNNSLF